MIYHLSPEEETRLREAILAVYAVPFIDDVKDYIWEAIICHVKQIDLAEFDPLVNIRKKHLYDVFDATKGIGWSAKAVQCPNTITAQTQFELVVQRADIFKKAEEMGFPPLSVNSPPHLLGEALVRHWIDGKVQSDAAIQSVHDKRVCVLLKSGNRGTFAYYGVSFIILEISVLYLIESRYRLASDVGWKG